MSIEVEEKEEFYKIMINSLGCRDWVDTIFEYYTSDTEMNKEQHKIKYQKHMKFIELENFIWQTRVIQQTHFHYKVDSFYTFFFNKLCIYKHGYADMEVFYANIKIIMRTLFVDIRSVNIKYYETLLPFYNKHIKMDKQTLLSLEFMCLKSNLFNVFYDRKQIVNSINLYKYHIYDDINRRSSGNVRISGEQEWDYNQQRWIPLTKLKDTYPFVHDLILNDLFRHIKKCKS